MKNSVKTASVLAEFQTDNIPNTEQCNNDKKELAESG
jgi:hypothetical protein